MLIVDLVFLVEPDALERAFFVGLDTWTVFLLLLLVGLVVHCKLLYPESQAWL